MLLVTFGVTEKVSNIAMPNIMVFFAAVCTVYVSI